MQLLVVTLLVAGALSAPAPQLSQIAQSGATRLVPLLLRDLEASPNTLIPVVVPAPTPQNIDETAHVTEEETSQVATDLDVAQGAQAEETVEAAIEKEVSEALAAEDAIDAAVEEVQSSGAPEAVVQAELEQAGEAKAAIEETVARDVHIAAEAEEKALVKISEDAADTAVSVDAEPSVKEETGSSDRELHTPLPDALSNVLATVIEAEGEQNAPAREGESDSVVAEQTTETIALEPELTDSVAASETEGAEPEVAQEVILVDAPENSAIRTEGAKEVAVEELSQVQENAAIDAGVSGNVAEDGSTGTQIIDIVEEGPIEVPSTIPEEERQISTVDDTIAEAEEVAAQPEEVLSGVVDVIPIKKASESVQNEASSRGRGKSLSSAAEAATAKGESGPVTEEVLTIDEATRSAIEAALTGQSPDTAAIVIFPQVTAETATGANLLIEEGLDAQTETPVLTEAGAAESEAAGETVATIPVDATADVVIVSDATPAAAELEQIPESSASHTAEVVSAQVAVEAIQPLSKQRPAPAHGNLLVNPATKSAFFSTSSFGSPISAANIILGQPVRVPGALGFSGSVAPQLQGSTNIQARNLVDPRFRQFIFDNDSPDVVAAKINFFRVRAATLGAPIAISVAPTPSPAPAGAPEAAASDVVAVESEPSAAPAAAVEAEPSSAPEAASSTTVEVAESAPSETS